MECDNELLVSADHEDIFDAIREELRLSREQRERSDARHAELQEASDARHAELQAASDARQATLQADSHAFFDKLRAESDARHAALQRDVLDSNRMVMQRMDGLVKETQVTLRQTSAAIREIRRCSSICESR